MYLEDFKVGDEFTSPGITLTLLGEASLGSPGIDELRWLKPVRPGDTLRVVAKVLETRRSTSKPDRGVVRMTYTTLNQRDEAVMSLIGTQLLKARSH